MLYLHPTKRNQISLLGQKGFFSRSFLLALVMTCLIVLGTSTTAQADPVVFVFQFDGTNNESFTPPIVGTGSFSFANDPGDGTHALTSLGAFSMSFTFAGTTFTNADIVTPLSEILVVISTQGLDRRIQFSNSNPSGFGTGPNRGSIDFFDGVLSLTFEPPGYDQCCGNGDGILDQYFVPGLTNGNYVGFESRDPIPEPTTMLLLGTGLAGVALKVRRRRKAQQSEDGLIH